MTAPIRYARSGDVNIAYQVTGDGPFDLVLVPGWFSHLEIDWEHPEHARFLDRFGSFARLIRFDKRGTGLSDRGVGLPDFETRMDDVRAVMDAVGSERAALFGYSEGGPMCILFAATYPVRTRALVLYGAYAKRLRSEDYPWAPTSEQRAAFARELEETWGENVDISTMIPNADPAESAWFQRRGRASLSPAGARDLILMNSKADVRELLPSVQCPTLVFHRSGDLDSRVEEGRYSAERIPGARFVELPGAATFRGSTWTRCSTWSRSSSRASTRLRRATVSWPLFCSRTSLARSTNSRRLETLPGLPARAPPRNGAPRALALRWSRGGHGR